MLNRLVYGRLLRDAYLLRCTSMPSVWRRCRGYCAWNPFIRNERIVVYTSFFVKKKNKKTNNNNLRIVGGERASARVIRTSRRLARAPRPRGQLYRFDGGRVAGWRRRRRGILSERRRYYYYYYYCTYNVRRRRRCRLDGTARQPPPLRIYAVFKNKRAGVFRKERAPSSRVRRRPRFFDNSWPTRPRVRPSSYRPDIANAPPMAVYYIIRITP